jgi:hypothetical protein
MEVSCQLHASAALSPGNEPLDSRLGWPQDRFECCGGEENILPLSGVELRFLFLTARDVVVPTKLSRLSKYVQNALCTNVLVISLMKEK